MKSLVLKKFQDKTNHNELVKKNTIYDSTEERAIELELKGLVKIISADVPVKEEEPVILTNTTIETATVEKKIIKPKSNKKHAKKRPIQK